MEEEKSAERPGRLGWRRQCAEYVCCDGACVATTVRSIRYPESEYTRTRKQTLPVNGVNHWYRSETHEGPVENGLYEYKPRVTISVSGTDLSRKMDILFRARKGLRTIVFPGTVEGVAESAFRGLSLGAVIMNEGLVYLGGV